MRILLDEKVLKYLVIGTAAATIGLTKLVKAEVKLLKKVVEQELEIKSLRNQIRTLDV